MKSKPKVFFVTINEHKYTVSLFLENYQHILFSPVHVIGYEEVWTCDVSNSVVVLCDLERFCGESLGVACDVYEHVLHKGALRVLNNPRRVLRRYELLRTLQAKGINMFNVYRVEEANSVRFPVFLRREREHDGTLTELLHTPAELDHELTVLVDSGIDADDILIVEFEDSRRADGLYAKLGAFVFGERFLPRHAFLSTHWHVKCPDEMTGVAARFESNYMSTPAFPGSLREVVQLAGVEYGRIDYAVHEGRAVVFEINTNPTIIDRGDLQGGIRSKTTQMFVVRFARTLNDFVISTSRASCGQES